MAATESYIQKLQRAQVHCSRKSPAERHRLLRHEPDRPTSIPRLLGPARFVATHTSFVLPHRTRPGLTLILRNKDSLEQQCLRPRSRISSPPMARLPLSRTIPRRCRRSSLEGTQHRPYNDRRISGTIQPRLYNFPVMIRPFRRYTMAVLRG